MTSTGLLSQRATDLSFIDFCTLVGLASSAISSFLAWTYIKAGRKLGQLREVRLPGIISTALTNGVVNLVGMGAALVGLQAALGSLLGKTLTAAPGPWGVAYRPTGAPPVALDVFSVQASACAIMAHFCGIVLGNWLLRVAHK
ncbi:hypothetical protein QBZ16_003473 [Prototheca wickerhamii]|uniref:Uncharacterized protein n=1 Tax=Prototheca wickerhamii TaxID=3111 RepID=A0AAD9MLT1_PROWI|nr:hypothetical protein QBZ16_003473 [Prototheca wickerhamii]